MRDWRLGLPAPPGGQASGEKGERPAAGTAKRSGFRACAENDCKNIIANSCRIASPNLTGKEVFFP